MSAYKNKQIATVQILHDRQSTVIDAEGAVKSTQYARLSLPSALLDSLWTPEYMERLACTYWRYLTRISLGLIRVIYGERDRSVVFITRRLPLLRFLAPTYELDKNSGSVLWQIKDGLLVEKQKTSQTGKLEIRITKETTEKGITVATIKVEVANFYPRIAAKISHRLYKLTQSRIHVIVAHGFLRSLAKIDLAESKSKRFSN